MNRAAIAKFDPSFSPEKVKKRKSEKAKKRKSEKAKKRKSEKAKKRRLPERIMPGGGRPTADMAPHGVIRVTVT
ncbi:hypothetical protein [Paraburkholderia diazotrophica]|uniref:hypothetical protein n=1 Tax=Paraburkholderia diazotrophica TaxID=667676 RepID=UPI00318292E1